MDVVELERAVLEVARQCTPVNLDPLHNPKVRISIGDAREFLLTSRTKYDVIFSEPSNPLPRGVSESLYAGVLSGRGLEARSRRPFVQWLQAYEVDAQTVKTSYGTLASVFGNVETWFTKKDDLLLAASAVPLPYRIPELRRRLQEQPFSNGMAAAWRVAGPEGSFRALCGARLAGAVDRPPETAIPNTDDRNRMEFGFARSLGQSGLFQSDELRHLARERGEDRPGVEGELDWSAVERQRFSTLTAEGVSGPEQPEWPQSEQQRAAAHQHFAEGRLGRCAALWLAAPWEPSGPLEMVMIGEAWPMGGDSRAVSYAAKLRELQPAEADAILARYLWTQQKWGECFAAAKLAFERYRTDPWPLHPVMQRLLAIIEDLPARDPSLAKRGCDLSRLFPSPCPFWTPSGRWPGSPSASRVDPLHTAEAFRPLEPNAPLGRRPAFEIRALAYFAAGDPRATIARAEQDAFWKRESKPFSDGSSQAALASNAAPGPFSAAC